MTDQAIEPAISVVMPAYNAEKYLADAIESILTQSFKDIEVIVVDDASTDRTLEITQKYQQQDKRLRYIALPNNQGMTAARNHGLASAHGEFVAFSDADDLNLPTRLQAQYEALKGNPHIGAVGIRSQVMNADLSRVILPKLCPAYHANIVLALFIGDLSIVGGAIMVRSELARKAGGWDENLRIGGEGDFFLCLLLCGARFSNIQQMLYIQREHDSNMSRQSETIAVRKTFLHHRRILSKLGAVDEPMLIRFSKFRSKDKLSWQDRRRAKKDMRRIVERTIELQMVDPADRLLLHSDIDRRLERASPRLWQQFCHWRRKRQGEGNYPGIFGRL